MKSLKHLIIVIGIIFMMGCAGITALAKDSSSAPEDPVSVTDEAASMGEKVKSVERTNAVVYKIPYLWREWDGSMVKDHVVTEGGNLPFPDNGVLETGWYFLPSSKTVSSPVTASGNVRLIIADGATLTANKGIRVNKGSTLNIYSQEKESGKIIAVGTSNAAGIGGAESDDVDGNAGTIIIHGGTIQATGGKNAAGIGGGGDGDGGTVIIYGGKVTATGSHYAAGIGGGNDDGSGGNITIYGGEVTAKGGDDGAGIGGAEDGDGGNITIHDGTITATAGNKAAAIGGGENGKSGTIEIHGGTINATSKDGAGIGSGEDDNAGNITITGGDITVNSRDGACIGGGDSGHGGVTTISGGTFTLHSGNGAGIGGGNIGVENGGDGGTITISGGTFDIHSEHGACIGGGRGTDNLFGDLNSGEGGNVTISGGTLNLKTDNAYAIGAGARGTNGGRMGYGGDITIKGNPVITFRADYGWGACFGGDDGTLNMSGGTVISEDDTDRLIYYWEEGTADGEVNISGGSLRGGRIIIELGDDGGGSVSITGGTHYLRNTKGWSTVNTKSLTLGDSMTVRKGTSWDDQELVKANEHVSTLKDSDKVIYTTIEPCKHSGDPVYSVVDDDYHIQRCEYCRTPFENEEHHFVDGICTDCEYEAANDYIVTIDPNNGESRYTEIVKRGNSLELPPEPSRPGYIFNKWHWLKDPAQEGNPQYDWAYEESYFPIPVESNMLLKASWNTEWGDLQKKIGDARNGGTITLDRDYTATAEDDTLQIYPKTYNPDAVVTIDLNGHTIDRGTVGPGKGRTVINIVYDRSNGAAKLIVKDSSEGQRGKIIGGSTGINMGIETTFTMEGGSITGNSGPGVSVSDTAAFIMNGGSITDNASGVYMLNQSEFKVSGDSRITRNTSGDVCLPAGKKINVTGQLEDTARIGVRVNDSPVQDPRVITNDITGKGTAENFFSNDDRYSVGINDGGAAYLGEAFTVSFDSDCDIRVPDQTVFKGNTVERPEDPVWEGYEFRGWQQDGEDYDFDTPVTSNISLKAKWDEILYTVSFDSGGGSEVEDQTVAHGMTAWQPEDPVREGFTFTGWQLDSEDYNFETPVSADIILKAVWQKDEAPSQEDPGGSETDPENQDDNKDPGGSGSGSGTTPGKAPQTDRPKDAISPKNPARAAVVEKAILTAKNDKDQKGSTFSLLRAKGVAKSKTSIKLTWAKVKGAKKYIIYGNKCGKKNKYKKIKAVTGKSFTQKKLKKGTYYKYLVVAVNGGKALATSKTIHVATKGGKVGNNTGVKLSKTKLILKTGKSKKIKAKLKKGSLKVKTHRKTAWESTNIRVAKVSSKGKIKAVGKGTCYVYAYAQNGVFAKVKVTVK